MLCDCPWRVRFKKQLNGSWIVTELRDEHQGHQLEGVDPLSYSVNRPIVSPAQYPAEVITDADKALMSARVGGIPRFHEPALPMAHRAKHSKNCRKHVDTLAAFDELMKCIKQIASSVNLTEQEKALETLQDKFLSEAVSYFLNQWWRDKDNMRGGRNTIYRGMRILE
ncbi:hypothetical protein LIPSTDRAFT_4133 [Lipomyces starkeyi NRRL Y-11557]|uniref:Uncharacterized protein n=1 Tax=Lipomyces starkeyi NRRL Y-11557 TaxID=675824 RepID=A0A1E3Q6I1_LIPST|nr:hypothetical protein LIPSTDRAFT_4133 [Lipomyces starkeyi NRRL Y-11557]